MTILDGLPTAASACEKYPLLAAKVMNVIASFSRLEALRLDLYLTILNTPDDKSVSRAYLSLDYGNAKNEFVDAIAKSKLGQNDWQYYEAITKAIKSYKKKRDKLAHGYWGYNTGIKDALILVNPKKVIGSIHNISENAMTKAQVYRAKDLDSMASENYHLCLALLLFSGIIDHHNSREARDSLYAKLTELPVIRDKIDHPA